MKRKLFCQISPVTYAVSVIRLRLKRHMENTFSPVKFAKTRDEALPVVVYKHTSLIRRRLGNVDMQLQENKSVNLSLTAPKINGILIRPQETFSFWVLVGNCSKRKGYKEGLTISSGMPSKGIGGGLCQFTNFLHWLVLHSPLEIVEHHHHDDIDMFPDYGRQVPFGCGTSICYNHADYRFKNNTNTTFQIVVYTTETHLCGELRASESQSISYHIAEEDACFVQLDDGYYRRNTIVRQVVDKRTGNELKKEVIKHSNAKVLYGEEFISKDLVRTE